MALRNEFKRLYITMIQNDRILFFADSNTTGLLAVDYHLFDEKKLLRKTVHNWFSRGTKVLGSFADVCWEMPNGPMRARCYLLGEGYPLCQNGIRPVFMGLEEFIATNPFPLEKEMMEQALLYSPIFLHPERQIPLLEEDAQEVQEKVDEISGNFLKIPAQNRDQFEALAASGSSLKRIRLAYEKLCQRYLEKTKPVAQKESMTEVIS